MDAVSPGGDAGPAGAGADLGGAGADDDLGGMGPTGETPPSAFIEFSGTVTPSAFNSAVAARPAGPLQARPGSGASTFTISGDINISRAQLWIDHANVQGVIDFGSSANGSSFRFGQALGFAIEGPDDVTIADSTFDGQGQTQHNVVWDAGQNLVPERFRILRNTIKNFYMSDTSMHSEGLFLGNCRDGLVEGNTIDNSGNTSLLFFSWAGWTGTASTPPANICVRGNTFGHPAYQGTADEAYYGINIRAEIPQTTNLAVDSSNIFPYTYRAGISAADWLERPCANPIPSTTSSPPPQGGSSGSTSVTVPTTANLWIDANGGSCTRSTSAASYADASACSSISAAFAACQPGDVIVIKSGTYGAQSVGQPKAAPGCTVIGESGTTIGVLSTTGSYLTLENVTVDAGGAHAAGGWHNAGSNITLKQVSFHGPFVSLDLGGSNVTWTGGELGQAGVTGGKRSCQLGDPEPVQIGNINHLAIDGVRFHPQDADETPVPCSSNGFHLEMVRIDQGANDVTIQNSTFDDGDHSNTSSIFITNVNADPGDPTNLHFFNNFFGSAVNPTFSVHANVQDCSTITIAYNTFHNAVQADGCAFRLIGNLAPWPSYNPCVGTHTKNVWQDDRSFSCGSDTVLVGTRGGTEKLGLGGTDGFHLVGGSPAIDAGEAGTCSTTSGHDHDGNPKPKGLACDAGAHELQ